MKKGVLLNSELSYIIAKLGHKDSIAVGDCGMPIPDQIQRVDLAVQKGVPDFMTVLKAVLSEQCIEKVILAVETKQVSPALHDEILSCLNEIEAAEGIQIEREYVTHDNLKQKTAGCKALVRTGECTSYANIILVSGVNF